MKALPCEVSTYAKSRKDIGVSDPHAYPITIRSLAPALDPLLPLSPSPVLAQTLSDWDCLSPQGPITCVGARRLCIWKMRPLSEKNPDLPRSRWAALCVVPPRG